MATKKSSTKQSAKKETPSIFNSQAYKALHQLRPPSQACLNACYETYQACLRSAPVGETALEKFQREMACAQQYAECTVACLEFPRPIVIQVTVKFPED